MSNHTLTKLGDPIEVNIRQSNRAKRIAVRWSNPKQQFELVLPDNANQKEAINFLESIEDKIRKNLAEIKAATESDSTDKNEKQYPTRIKRLSSITIPSGQFEIKYVSGNKHDVVQNLKTKTITVYSAPQLSNSLLQTWLLQKAKLYLINRTKKLAKEHKKNINNISVKETNAQWGSCSSDNNISLSWRLYLMPIEASDYVIIHELAHIKHRDHSPDFWNEVQKMMPNYEDAYFWIKKHQKQIMGVLR